LEVCVGKVSTAKAREQFSDVVNRVAYGKERVILTRRKKELAAVVPIEDVKLLEELENRLDLEDARAALLDTKKKGTVSWEKIKLELGL
jgi:prevent-host-death family protein